MTFLLIFTILVIFSTVLAEPSSPDFDTGLLIPVNSVFLTVDDTLLISCGDSTLVYYCTATSCSKQASYLGGTFAAYEFGIMVASDSTNLYYFTCPTLITCTQVASTPLFLSTIEQLVLSDGVIFAGYPNLTPGSPGYIVSYTYSGGELIASSPIAPNPSSCSQSCPYYGYSIAALDGQYATCDSSQGEAYYPSRNFYPTGSAADSYGWEVSLGFDSSSGLQLFYVSAPLANSGQGLVYVYTCSASTCQSAYTLASPSPGSDFNFGESIAANENKLLVAQSGGGGPDGNGLIYFFTCTSTGCTTVSSFYPSYSSPDQYAYQSITIGTNLGAQVDVSLNPSVFSLPSTSSPSSSDIFSGSAYSPIFITPIPTVAHPRHDCLISNGVINDGGFTITTSDGTDYCCRFQGILQGGQCGAIKCASSFVAQGVSTYFENDDGSHCFALCYTQGSGTTSVPIFQGSQYNPGSPVSLSATVQGGLDCLLSSGTVDDAGYLVTDPSSNQYCCRSRGSYTFGECTHQVCGTSQPWSSATVFYDPSNTCFTQCFASS